MMWRACFCPFILIFDQLEFFFTLPKRFENMKRNMKMIGSVRNG